MQSLISKRNEVERWANKNIEVSFRTSEEERSCNRPHVPPQFHFATVLSPWIRRGLIAGGFGIGSSSSNAPTEIAPVVPYRGGRSQIGEPSKAADIEAIEESLQADGGDGSPIVPEDTPFFHFDLTAAVRAAEAGLGVDRSERSSIIKSPGHAKTEVSA